MDLLDWARGPLLAASLLVLVLGTAWRVAALLRLPARREPTHGRQVFGWPSALRAAFGRFAVPKGFAPSATLVTTNPYIFHIGLAVVVFGYAPHIAFVRRLTGLSWPALPDAVDRRSQRHHGGAPRERLTINVSIRRSHDKA